MGASLCVHISSPAKEDKQAIDFFHEADWTPDSEADLIQRLHELLSLMRPIGSSIQLNIEIEVKDPQYAVFLIQKKIHQSLEFNHQKLSAREMEVLGLIMQGLTNQEIADKLFISFETVRSHRKNILLKTGSKNTASLINYYHQTFSDR
jgi:DNA-binding CsgD family transcriptional regulator